MPGFKPGFASCFAIRTRCTLACLDTSVSRHPLSALAVRRIPAESPLRRIDMRRFCLPGFKPGFASCFAIRTRCTLACLDTSVSRHPLSALAVRRIPAESPLRRIGMRRFCLPGFSPGHLAFRKVLPGARRCVPRSLCGAARLTSRAVLLRPFAPHVARIPAG